MKSGAHRILDDSAPLKVRTYPGSPQLNPTVQDLCELLLSSTTNWETLIERVCAGDSRATSRLSREPPANSGSL